MQKKDKNIEKLLEDIEKLRNDAGSSIVGISRAPSTKLSPKLNTSNSDETQSVEETNNKEEVSTDKKRHASLLERGIGMLTSPFRSTKETVIDNNSRVGAAGGGGGRGAAGGAKASANTPESEIGDEYSDMKEAVDTARGGGGEGTKDGVGADVRPVAAADAGGRGASSTDVDEIIQNAIEKVERSHVIDILKLTQNQLKTVPTLF